eukprot:UN04033
MADIRTSKKHQNHNHLNNTTLVFAALMNELDLEANYVLTLTPPNAVSFSLSDLNFANTILNYTISPMKKRANKYWIFDVLYEK